MPALVLAGDMYLSRVRKQNMPFWDGQQVVALLEGAGFSNVELVANRKAFVLVRGTKA